MAAGAAVAQAVGRGPDERAAAIVARMTASEKTVLTHGIMALPTDRTVPIPRDAVIGAGYVAGIPRLHVAALKETDASLGVAYVSGLRPGAGATALPSTLATASSFDTGLAAAAGAMIGREAAQAGFNVLLGGGVDLARDPAGGRNFEYLGEDPLLAGTLAGAAIAGTQGTGVISTVKHFALNDQESGRDVLNAVIDPAAARESDLLAFEIAIERGRPGAVMCAYNRVNGPYACDDDWLLNGVLKGDWHFPGFVMSDWGATHGLAAAAHGLDQQSGQQLDAAVVFGAPLQATAAADPAVARRLDDMNRRILRSVFAVQEAAGGRGADAAQDAMVARRVADEGIVLLRNQDGLLPLAGVRSIAVIGGHADIGVISGGGSSQVAPKGGPALAIHVGGEGSMAGLRTVFYLPSSPLAAVRADAPRASVRFDDGAYPSRAASLARRCDVAIVFATQWMMEGYDAPDLTLPDGQDALIAAVAAANPRTIVVLETGGPVLMPWLGATGAVMEAWYPGAQGGVAIADALFGVTDPSGRLPISFPASMAQLPRGATPGMDLPQGQAFEVRYGEGSDVGYRWFARAHAAPLFAFGSGLGYSRFSYGGLSVQPFKVGFSLHNDGGVAGVEVAQLYLLASPRRRQQRLLGWARVALLPGETRAAQIDVDPRLLADWDEAAHGWRLDGGSYRVAVSAAADAPRLQGEMRIMAAQLAP